jgi:hypothetical protein
LVTDARQRLAESRNMGMFSSMSVTFGTSNWPKGTVLSQVVAVAAISFNDTQFEPATGSSNASGTLSSTGVWGTSVTLVDTMLNKTEVCKLPDVSVACMPTFVAVNGGCECRVGFRNINGECVSGEASVCDTANLSFSGGRGGSKPQFLHDNQVAVVDDDMVLDMTLESQPRGVLSMDLRMLPTAGSRSASMSISDGTSNLSGLLQPGNTPTGTYELIVSDSDPTGCKSQKSFRIKVKCKAGYSAFPEGTSCTANLDPRKCNMTVRTSSGMDVVDGVQVEAGEKLTVRFAAFDLDGQPISRPNLGIELNISGRFNGANGMPLQLVENGTFYEARLPEIWIREPEPVVIALKWLPCESPDCPKLVTFKVIEPSKQKLIIGGVAGGLAICVLLATVYLFAKHGAKAKGIVLAIVEKDAKMVWSLFGEVFDLSGDTVMFLAILADASDPLRRAKVERILVVVWVSFSLSVVISAVSLVVKGGVVMTLLRRRRSSFQMVGRVQSYGRALAGKIEDAENRLKEVLLAARPGRRRTVLRHGAFFATCRCTSTSPSPSSRTSRWRALGCTTCRSRTASRCSRPPPF